jgi:glycosyltransferase involved in cell wall biosynthesis
MKPILIFSGPVQSRSGYGEHARDIVRALIKLDKFDIRIIPIRWGNTPLNVLKPKEDDDILLRIMKDNKVERQPEISVQLTVPNEFQQIAKYNIGITAGIETTVCSVEWIQGLNRMDLNIVPSKFSKEVFLNTSYNRNDAEGNAIEVLKVEKPIEVVFEGVDVDTFYNTVAPSSIRHNLNDISESFAFLFVGHWLQGDIGADRKDVGMLVKTFLETFKGRKNKPALILKTGSTFSQMDRDDLFNKIKTIKDMVKHPDLPNIYILLGELTKQEMAGLYHHSKVKAHISFTRGEGFGRPLLEASLSGKPILASGWSGHLDFLPRDLTILLPGKLSPVHPSAVWDKVILAESQWFTVNYTYASNAMLDVFNRYTSFEDSSKKLAQQNRNNFSFDKMTKLLDEILEKNLPKFLVQQNLVIPKLKKIEKPKENE